jgi:hypothetical protein
MPRGQRTAEGIFHGICRSSWEPPMGSDIEPYDIIGFAGAAIFVGTYFANQQRWLSSEDWRFPFLNLIGAVLILISLIFEWTTRRWSSRYSGP